MGRSNKRKRKQAILKANPVCYRCASAATTTIDHVPSRQCFLYRRGPEGYEFAACDACNQRSSSIEQGAAFTIAFANLADRLNPHPDELVKMLQHVRNNTPTFVPLLDIDYSTKKKALKQIGYTLSYGETVESVPIAMLDGKWRPHMHEFARKLLCALYYKHIGQPISLDQYMRTEFYLINPVSTSTMENIYAYFRKHLPNIEAPRRGKRSLHDQFIYYWGGSGNSEVCVFMAKFRISLLLIGIASVAPDDRSLLTDSYIKHGDEIAWGPGDIDAFEG